MARSPRGAVASAKDDGVAPMLPGLGGDVSGQILQVQGAGGDQPVFSVVLMTPERARQLMHEIRPSAKVNPAAVRTYAQAMREGRWILNGMPIILSKSGRLLDGLQRLRACVDAGVPFQTTLAENIPDDVLHTIDQQRRRSFAGVLEARGVANAHSLQGALIKLIRYDDGTVAKGVGSAPWSRMDRVLRANPGIEEAVDFSLSSHARALSEAVRSPVVFMGFQVDRVKTERFLDAIANPDNYDHSEPGGVLRTMIESRMGDSEHRYRPAQLFAITLKALNDTLSGQTHRVYRWPDRAEKETEDDFPKLVGYQGLRDPGHADETPETAAKLAKAVEDLADRQDVFPLTIETITPELAEKYLEANSRNRKIIAAHVDAIARDIKNGRWMMNAQPICFARNGRLLNGQHRLSAVIASGQSIEVPVMRGLPEEAYATYDLHAKRGPLVASGFENFGDKPLVSAAAVLLWKHEIRQPGVKNAKPTSAEVMEIVQAHPLLIDLRTFGRKMIEFGRASVLMYAAYRILRDNRELGEVFLERFESGAELPAGHLILKLRRRMSEMRKGTENQAAQLREIMQAWEEFKRRPDLPAKMKPAAE